MTDPAFTLPAEPDAYQRLLEAIHKARVHAIATESPFSATNTQAVDHLRNLCRLQLNVLESGLFPLTEVPEPAAALAQQPAVGEEIMVNAAHDVFILPLHPSGLSSGPRFVVHVPGPEKPAAVDGLAARLVDELDGLVGESYGVSGLHLNGDVATWDELLPGGRFERLSSLDELRAALAAMDGQGEAKPAAPTHDGGENWKARALSAEADIERMTDAFNRENGPTLMGEPVLPPEKTVELEPGVRVPAWLLAYAKRVELYMKANLPGPWRIGGIQSHDYEKDTPPPSAVPEGLTARDRCVLRFALHRFMGEAYARHNEASQKTTAGLYASGAAERFYRDAKDAERLLSVFAAAPEPGEGE